MSNVVKAPIPRLRDEALRWADRRLEKFAHSGLTLAKVAKICGKSVPAAHKAFGSHLEFLASLSAMQWERFANSIQSSDGSALGVALAAVAFAIAHPHRFWLMYEPAVWAQVEHITALERSQEHTENGFVLVERERDTAFALVTMAVDPHLGATKVRLIASLVTGLSFEYANERLYKGDRAQQMAEAEELLRMVLP